MISSPVTSIKMKLADSRLNRHHVATLVGDGKIFFAPIKKDIKVRYPPDPNKHRERCESVETQSPNVGSRELWISELEQV